MRSAEEISSVALVSCGRDRVRRGVNVEMKRFKNILVATDTRLDFHPIVDEAAEIARHNNASLKIVDVVPEFPWAVRFSLKDHEHIRKLIGQEKQANLESLADAIRKNSIQVQTKTLFGRTSIEVIREVMRGGHDLVLRVAKGKDSRRRGFFGTTAIRLLRQCPCAVWLVSPTTTPRFQHVLGCIDTPTTEDSEAELDDQIYELASSISRYHDGRFSIVHAWSVLYRRLLKNRMRAEDFVGLEKQTHDQTAKLVSKFLEKHGSNISANNVHLINGEPPVSIENFIRQNDVDLVVMGTVGRSGLSGTVIGNTAEQILDRIECSVLAIKPDNFKCPIALGD